MSPENKRAHVVAVVLADEIDKAAARGFIGAALAVAVNLGTTVDALIVGAQVNRQLARDAVQAGATRVTVISHSELSVPVHTDQLLAVLDQALPQALATARSSGNVALCLFHADAVGEELAARLAARMDGVALGRCSLIEGGGGGLRIHKSVFGGRMNVVLDVNAGPCFSAIRAGKVTAIGVAAQADPDAPYSISLDCQLPTINHIARSPVQQQRKRLEGARTIVSGGRGMGGPEGFLQLQELADALGAATGGSLPTVDAGWVPVSHQVGQSGKYVTPDIYVAVALSGTPQHMAGIGPDTDIIAINNDPEAAIFSVATIGAVADWKDLLPVLAGRIRAGVSARHE